MSAIFLRLLLFLLPLALFLLIVRIVRQGRDPEGAINAGTVRLVSTVSIAGVAIFILVLVYLNIGRDDNRSLKYVVPQTIDGEVEPGHFEAPAPQEGSEEGAKEDEDGG